MGVCEQVLKAVRFPEYDYTKDFLMSVGDQAGKGGSDALLRLAVQESADNEHPQLAAVDESGGLWAIEDRDVRARWPRVYGER